MCLTAAGRVDPPQNAPRINAAHRERLALLALDTPTITQLERPHVQNLIKGYATLHALQVLSAGHRVRRMTP